MIVMDASPINQPAVVSIFREHGRTSCRHVGKRPSVPQDLFQQGRCSRGVSMAILCSSDGIVPEELDYFSCDTRRSVGLGIEQLRRQSWKCPHWQNAVIPGDEMVFYLTC